MPQLAIHPRAERDLDELVAYIARDNPDAAVRFFEAARETFQLLLRSPDLGSRWDFQNPRLADIRVWHAGRFRKHLIFYRPTTTGIEIVRVLHGARDIESLFESNSD